MPGKKSGFVILKVPNSIFDNEFTTYVVRRGGDSTGSTLHTHCFYLMFFFIFYNVLFHLVFINGIEDVSSIHSMILALTSCYDLDAQTGAQLA